MPALEDAVSDGGFATGLGEDVPLTPQRSRSPSLGGASSAPSEFYYAVDASGKCQKAALMLTINFMS